MTTHDDTLHPRDNASGEFTTKNQTSPETSIPGPSEADLAIAELEAEFAGNSVARNELDRKEFELAQKILAAKIANADLKGDPHTLLLVDGNSEGTGAPYWEPSVILDPYGKVLWEVDEDDDEDELKKELSEYTAVLDRLGDEGVWLPNGNHGIHI